MPHPHVFIVSGPSGVGKSSIIQAVLQRRGDTRLSISTTTRGIRAGEADGREYHFVDKPTFERMIGEDGFLEWARSYDNYYGTGRTQIEEILAQGRHALLDIDTQGALNIQRRFQGAVYIFIEPPSLADLENRLRGRGSETEETLAKRLSRAEAELAQAVHYDHVVVNADMEAAIAEVMAIMDRVSMQPGVFQPIEGPAAGAGEGAEGTIADTLEPGVRAALRNELEGLIRERIEKVLDTELEAILEETYQEMKKA